jgi:steroid delta-isomerase-like uncharacterized protein
MDRAELEKYAKESIETFNRADWDGLRALLSSDTVYEEAGTGRRCVGPDELIEALIQWKTAFPDVAGEITRMVVDDDLTVLQLVWRGTHTGPLETPAGAIPASGSSMEIESTTWQDWADGRLTYERHHLDVLTLLRQIGALPTG